MFKDPFSFDGRIRRTEYGISLIIYGIVHSGLNTIARSIEHEIPLLLLIPILWFLFAQGAKRCHDIGNSGWYQIIPLYVFSMVFHDSDHGQNNHGPNPKSV
ncbi:MAG: DUF805 domain-containing protein [Saprospiraceae bacterium]|nr:DUF805 domain-containing protein [Saprospiraceae bacterium]